MDVLTGDLLLLAEDGRFDVIVHGCNCQCVMGKGIAKAIKAKFPEAYTADCATAKGDAAKMGTISTATVQRGDHQITVVNGYTQIHWRGKEAGVDYDAMRAVFHAVKQQFSGSKIGYPRIGAGLGGGDWNRIAQIIDEELAGEDHALVEFAG